MKRLTSDADIQRQLRLAIWMSIASSIVSGVGFFLTWNPWCAVGAGLNIVAALFAYIVRLGIRAREQSDD